MTQEHDDNSRQPDDDDDLRQFRMDVEIFATKLGTFLFENSDRYGIDVMIKGLICTICTLIHTAGKEGKKEAIMMHIIQDLLNSTEHYAELEEKEKAKD